MLPGLEVIVEGAVRDAGLAGNSNDRSVGVAVFADHSAAALNNARRVSSVFSMRLREGLSFRRVVILTEAMSPAIPLNKCINRGRAVQQGKGNETENRLQRRAMNIDCDIYEL